MKLYTLLMVSLVLGTPDYLVAQGNQRPLFYTSNYQQRVDLAQQMGKPILYWVDETPTSNADADVFFTSFPEAVHILNNSHPAFPGKTRGVVFRAKDGWDYWVSSDKLNATTAEKVRERWEGEKKPLDRKKVLQTLIPINDSTEMTLDGYIARGGVVSATWCKEAGFDEAEINFILSLQTKPQPQQFQQQYTQQQQQPQQFQQQPQQFNKTPQQYAQQPQRYQPQRMIASAPRASGRIPVGGS